MHQESTQLDEQSATRVLSQVMGKARYEEALIMLPTWMGHLAKTLERALNTLGVTVSLRSMQPPDPSSMSVSACADRWVPRNAPSTTLMVLSGVRPWSHSIEGDHLIEIEAMTRREALLAQGQRILFIDWPQGARRDAEIDLRPEAMVRIYRRALEIDYPSMRAWNQRLYEALAGAKHLHIRCPEGSDLKCSVQGRSWLKEDCLLGEKEPAVYLPGGEIYAPVMEESAEGRVVFHHMGHARIAYFKRGKLLSVERRDGSSDEALAEEMGVGVEPLCEVGIGSNQWAPPWQIGTIYEKSAGTLHVAVGGNAHFGGLRDSPRHMDLIIRAPTLEVDGTSLSLPSGLWDQKEDL